MRYDKDKIDDVALALLYLNLFQDQHGFRAWKGLPWEVTDRLHEKGYILDPKSKAKSVVVTEEGRQRAQEMFEKHFLLPEDPG